MPGSIKATTTLKNTIHDRPEYVVCYNGELEKHPLLYPLVLTNRDELVAKGCIFKRRSPDLRES